MTSHTRRKQRNSEWTSLCLIIMAALRSLQIIWNEINVIYMQIVVLLSCFISHTRDRWVRSVINCKQSTIHKFWPHFVERAARNVFARVQSTNDNWSIIMHTRIWPITGRLVWAEEREGWISRQSNKWFGKQLVKVLACWINLFARSGAYVA